MSQSAFLGTGMRFPPQVEPGTGRFALSAGERSVKESVYLILMTNQGERWLEPDFGSQMLNYTFMDTSLTMLRILSDNLRDLILRLEPRISSVDIQIDPQAARDCLVINVIYQVAATNSRDNLVFPFYLNNQGEEIQNEI